MCFLIGRQRQRASETYSVWKWRLISWCAGLVLVLAIAWKTYYLHLHFRERYTSAHAIFTSEKISADELVRQFCHAKPRDYQSALVNCTDANMKAVSDPHSRAFEDAWAHISFDHLSFTSWIADCHDGICTGWIYRWSERLLMNLDRLIMFCCIVAFILLVVTIWVAVNCRASRKEAVRVARLLENSPAQRLTQTAQQSIADFARTFSNLEVFDVAEANKKMQTISEQYTGGLKELQQQQVAIDTEAPLPPVRRRKLE